MIAAIHGEVDRLRAVHRRLGERLQPGDRLVYGGNVLGRGNIQPTLAELFRFRNLFLCQRGAFAADIVYLRGAQEEMWNKLLQVHFAPQPHELLTWMFDQGVDATLAAYGVSAERALDAARQGSGALGSFTTNLRAAIRQAPGHDAWLVGLRWAAHTDDRRLLMVHAGLDPDRPLDQQRDSFWWQPEGCARLDTPYEGFVRVVRGYDPRHGGLTVRGYCLSVDGGCGHGGPLLAVAIRPEDGEVDDIIEE